MIFRKKWVWKEGHRPLRPHEHAKSILAVIAALLVLGCGLFYATSYFAESLAAWLNAKTQ